MECSWRLWLTYYVIGFTLVFYVFFRDELPESLITFLNKLSPDPLLANRKTIFRNKEDLQRNCHAYNYYGRHPGSKGQLLKPLHSASIPDIVRSFPSKLIKLDLAHEILYCLPAKTGATNWNRLGSTLKRNITFDDLVNNFNHDVVYNDQPTLYDLREILLIASKYKDRHEPTRAENFKRRFLDDFGYDRAAVGLDSFTADVQTAILVARHPLIRLYSAWSHRMSDTHRLHKNIFKDHVHEINTYHTHPDDGKVPVGLFTTFSAFLRFVSNDTAHHGVFLNPHWQTITDRCKPCELVNLYTAVAKTETNTEDAQEFLDSQGYSWVGTIPPAYTSNDGSGMTRGEIAQSSDVSRRIKAIKTYYRKRIKPSLVRRVYDQYYWDFKLFGYTLEGFVE